MATTSDGISEEDWNPIQDICLRIAEAVEADDERLEGVAKEELFEHLDRLERKYGECPSILSTKADYVDSVKDKVVLLQKAFEIAKTNSDFTNLTLIASSLAQAYIEDLNDVREGKKWLNELKSSLNSHWDAGEAEEFQRLSRTIRFQS